MSKWKSQKEIPAPLHRSVLQHCTETNPVSFRRVPDIQCSFRIHPLPRTDTLEEPTKRQNL